MKIYLGIDVGSVSTNVAVIDESSNVISSSYIRTRGEPIKAVQKGLKEISERLDPGHSVSGVGTTGSARHLTGILVGADVVKNEITAHAVAASHFVPSVRTVFEIGGQDSKIIFLRNGIVADFGMNSVCAAGTGSFLDQQAGRLGIPIEEFGAYALRSGTSVRIAGRCTVFAETDMIHKQQLGHPIENVIAGLCDAMVRNYLNNLVRGREVEEPIVFQGGVAANIGIKAAFERELNKKVSVPQYYNVMGAVGAALLAKEEIAAANAKTNFKGFEITNFSYRTSSFECKDCANICEIVDVSAEGSSIAKWGDRCGKFSNSSASSDNAEAQRAAPLQEDSFKQKCEQERCTAVDGS